MRRLFLVAALAVFALPSHAGEFFSGVIVATTSTTNLTTAATFTLPTQARIAVQCDAAAYIRIVKSGQAVTSANGVKVAVDALYDTSTTSNESVVAVLPLTGTVNCKVFVVR